MSAVAHGKFHGKRLVVFGCGYLGSEVARQAVARGMSVAALTRNAAKAVLLRQAGIDTIVADLASSTWHDRIAPGAELVLNTVSSGGMGIEGYRRSYVEGMGSLLRWAACGGAAGTIVYTSSTAVYPQSGGVFVDEQATPGRDERASLLLEAEETLRAHAAVCRRWFVLRLAGIYGPGRHHLLTQVRTGEIAGKGDHRLNLAHRDDIVAAIWGCFESPASISNQIFNVTDDHPSPKAEIVGWIARKIGAPVPQFTGVPAEGRRTITPDRRIVNAKLKSTLGWQPQYASYREGYENLLSR